MDPFAGSPVWQSGPNLSISRGASTTGGALFGAMAVGYKNYIYVYGGTDALNFFYGNLIRLDTVNISAGWTNVSATNPPSMWRATGLVGLINNTMYCVGGWDTSNGFKFAYSTFGLNLDTMVWSNITGAALQPAAIGDFTYANRGCLVVLNSSLYFMRNAYFLRWTPGDSSWTQINTTAPWNTTKNNAFSCAEYNGTVLQMFGTKVTAYDPSTGSFTAFPTPTMSHKYPIALNVKTVKNNVLKEMVWAPAAVDAVNVTSEYYNGTWNPLPKLVSPQKAEYMTTVFA